MLREHFLGLGFANCRLKITFTISDLLHLSVLLVNVVNHLLLGLQIFTLLVVNNDWCGRRLLFLGRC